MALTDYLTPSSLPADAADGAVPTDSERMITVVATVLAVLVVAAIAVLMGMA